MTDETHACPVEGCEYTTRSKRETMVHFGRSHNDDVKKTTLLNALRQLADELGKTPTQKEMNECGVFFHPVYGDHFGSWSEALKAVGLGELDHECPVDGCEYTSESKTGVGAHFTQGHDDEVIEEVYLDEIRHLATDSTGRHQQKT